MTHAPDISDLWMRRAAWYRKAVHAAWDQCDELRKEIRKLVMDNKVIDSAMEPPVDADQAVRDKGIAAKDINLNDGDAWHINKDSIGAKWTLECCGCGLQHEFHCVSGGTFDYQIHISRLDDGAAPVNHKRSGTGHSDPPCLAGAAPSTPGADQAVRDTGQAIQALKDGIPYAFAGDRHYAVPQDIMIGLLALDAAMPSASREEEAQPTEAGDAIGKIKSATTLGEHNKAVSEAWMEKVASLKAEVADLKARLAAREKERANWYDEAVECGRAKNLMQIERDEARKVSCKVVHCAECGGSYYDSGMSARCPHCRLAEAQAAEIDTTRTLFAVRDERNHAETSKYPVENERIQDLEVDRDRLSKQVEHLRSVIGECRCWSGQPVGIVCDDKTCEPCRELSQREARNADEG